jgi:hypothetical protein
LVIASVGYTGPIIETTPAGTAARLAVALAGLYPAEVRLRGARSIRDQKRVNCCVSCALAVCIEVLHPEYGELSPLFHYCETGLQRRGQPPGIQDGIGIQDGLDTLGSAGICLRSLHDLGYDTHGVTTVPSLAAEADGRQRAMPYLPHRYVSGYSPLDLDRDPINECKQALAKGRPILAGIHLTTDYQDSKLAELDTPGPRTGARHVVAILGYSDAKHSFIVQDSRGPDFALGGQWWLSYFNLTSAPALVFQAFAIGYPP